MQTQPIVQESGVVINVDFCSEAPVKESTLPRTVVENGKRINTQCRILNVKEDSRSADPIRREEDINKIISELLTRERWRDAMLFVVGCNTAWRVSDLISLRVCNVVKENGELMAGLTPEEKKTGHFRKVYYNKAIWEMMLLYLEKDASLRPTSYLFPNNSRNKRFAPGGEDYEYMTRFSVTRLVKKEIENAGLTGQFSSHSLRQTFSYHLQKMLYESPEKAEAFMTIQMLQTVLGHSKTSSTMHYSKYAEEKISEIYQNLNLGFEAITAFKNNQSV